MAPGARTRTRPRRSFREIVRLTLHSRGSPEAVARGFAIGLFIAFSPTIGFQVALALLLATLLRANRPAAFLSVFVTNPATIPPLFGLTYTVGEWFLPGRSPDKVRGVLSRIAAQLRDVEIFALHAQVREFFKIGMDLFWPMLVGGLIVGGAAAAVSYPAVLWFVRRIRRRRRRRLGSALFRGRAARAGRSAPGPGPEGPARNGPEPEG